MRHYNVYKIDRFYLTKLFDNRKNQIPFDKRKDTKWDNDNIIIIIKHL